MSTTLKIRQRAVGGRPQEEDKASRSLSPAARAYFPLLGLTAMFIIAALWRPPDEPQWVLCPFRALTHYPCPGCGMTRAFCALAHFEFWRAVRFNALSPILFLAALGWWAWSAATVFHLKRVRAFLARFPRPSPAAVKIMLALVMVWWAARLAVGV